MSLLKQAVCAGGGGLGARNIKCEVTASNESNTPSLARNHVRWIAP